MTVVQPSSELQGTARSASRSTAPETPSFQPFAGTASSAGQLSPGGAVPLTPPPFLPVILCCSWNAPAAAIHEEMLATQALVRAKNSARPHSSFCLSCGHEGNFAVRASCAPGGESLWQLTGPLSACSIGAFGRGPYVGLCSLTAQHGSFCRLMNRLINHLKPDHIWSSISISKNMLTPPHRDQQNHASDTLLVGLSHFVEGGVWVEGEGGCHFEDTPYGLRGGFRHCNHYAGAALPSS